MREAYEARQWAFVSDYARLDICYTYGGIYLDTDVETIKPFDDLLELDGFCGMEMGKNIFPDEVNTGLVLGMRQNLEMGRILRDDYHSLHFLQNDGSYDLTPCPVIQTKILREMGLKLDNKIQKINDLTIFPTDYFCPMNQYTGDIIITDNTYSIHHYFASWVSSVDQRRRELRMRYSFCGRFVSNVISTFVAYSSFFGFFGMWREVLKKIYGNKKTKNRVD
jgi:hypothetical protein